MKGRKDSYEGCNQAKLAYLHRRVACCPECHTLDALDNWKGYEWDLPSGQKIYVCCEVGDALSSQDIDSGPME